MKNIIKYFIPLVLIFILAGCYNDTTHSEEVNNFQECVDAGNPVMESDPRQCEHEGELFVEGSSNGDNRGGGSLDDMKSICELNDGEWLEDYNECEYISESVCSEMGGEFDECASACRNDPDYPEVACTMQCVPVCSIE